MYYVVKPADADGEPRAFLSPKAANEWVQTGAYHSCGADLCETYTVDVVSREEAIEKVRTGQAGKPVRGHRRLTADEIETRQRLDAIMELKELGL